MKTCAQTRSAIQDRLDAALLAEDAAAIEAHLSRCAACREYDEEMRTVVGVLRGTPAVPFPEAALEQVWRRTSRQRPGRPVFRVAWKVAAAAAILTAALLPALFRPLFPDPSPVELAQAREEARLVLGLAGDAIRRTELARDQILRAELSRALRRVPLGRPEHSLDESRR